MTSSTAYIARRAFSCEFCRLSLAAQPQHSGRYRSRQMLSSWTKVPQAHLRCICTAGPNSLLSEMVFFLSVCKYIIRIGSPLRSFASPISNLGAECYVNIEICSKCPLAPCRLLCVVSPALSTESVGEESTNANHQPQSVNTLQRTSSPHCTLQRLTHYSSTSIGVVTSLDSRPSEIPARMHAKPKVEIYLDRSPRFEEVMARLDAERQARFAARQREESQENAVPNGQMWQE